MIARILRGIREELDRSEGGSRKLVIKMAQALQSYKARHDGDVWNSPGWVYAPTVTMPIGKAADFLGISALTLIRNTDLWGFTVYRTNGHRRYYLISELGAFKDKGPKLTASDIKRATKGGKNVTQITSKKATDRKRT